ncbi:hypothetical protein OC842_000626 [Tilletia horrida]|uniref:Uncharacterized protein n=1 Tax=Tilletia horrida TaxID=155126 RepID=A0AAN6GGP7_9BASI|nr:hypothetical protein OC842_000626 [Tilletia horrida]
MTLPVRAIIWTSLNLLRLLSIVASLLVFVSTITSMVADGRGVQRAQHDGVDVAALGCDYIPGTDVPVHVWGIFWAHLNRTFELFLLVFCILSELNWGGAPERVFSYTLPILSRSFGTAPLGLLQMILACSNLSHELGNFPLATNWILFIIGIFNVLAGAIFKAPGKNVRSFHASRRAAVADPPGGSGTGAGVARGKDADWNEKSFKPGLPFAHRWSSKPHKEGQPSNGLRQLRYLRDGTAGAPIVSVPIHAGPSGGGGAAVIGRPSQAFTSDENRKSAGQWQNARNSALSIAPPQAGNVAQARSAGGGAAPAPPATESVAASTAGRNLPPSEVYIYDSDTDRIRMPLASQSAPSGAQKTLKTSTTQPAKNPPASSSSAAFNLARAVVTRAEELARARIRKTDPPASSSMPVSAAVSKFADPAPVLDTSNTSVQYHVRYGERGEGYGEHWRGHLRQRSSASLTLGQQHAGHGAGAGPSGSLVMGLSSPPSAPQRVLYSSRVGMVSPGRPF